MTPFHTLTYWECLSPWKGTETMNMKIHVLFFGWLITHILAQCLIYISNTVISLVSASLYHAFHSVKIIELTSKGDYCCGTWNFHKVFSVSHHSHSQLPLAPWCTCRHRKKQEISTNLWGTLYIWAGISFCPLPFLDINQQWICLKYFFPDSFWSSKSLLQSDFS